MDTIYVMLLGYIWRDRVSKNVAYRCFKSVHLLPPPCIVVNSIWINELIENLIMINDKEKHVTIQISTI